MSRFHAVELRSAAPSIRFPDPSGRSLQAVVASAPIGAVIELAPGRYVGGITIRHPMTIKGAGELTRIAADDSGSVIDIDCEEPGLIFVESVAIESGAAERGGGVLVRRGRVRLYNVRGSACRAREEGGFLYVGGGEVEASLVRINGCRAARGGAIALEGSVSLVLKDSDIRDSEADFGGGISVRGRAMLRLDGVALGKTHATQPSGGQAISIGAGHAAVNLVKVRFEDVPLGQPMTVEPGSTVSLKGCDLPSDVLRNPGIADEGENRWR
ncbi:MAG: hypothetical protein ACFB9M_20920 [Myxococcota bacterium]